jgi:hypothetical protein
MAHSVLIYNTLPRAGQIQNACRLLGFGLMDLGPGTLDQGPLPLLGPGPRPPAQPARHAPPLPCAWRGAGPGLDALHGKLEPQAVVTIYDHLVFLLGRQLEQCVFCQQKTARASPAPSGLNNPFRLSPLPASPPSQASKNAALRYPHGYGKSTERAVRGGHRSCPPRGQ